MKLSLCITTYNRIQYLRESFEQVINHPRIDEIILMDDCSDLDIFKQVEALKELSPKIKVYRQARNRGMSRNKADAISYAQNEWVILFDSDNVIDASYIDALPIDLIPEVIYQPDFAKPHFDFRRFSRIGGSYISGDAPIQFISRFNIRQPIYNVPMLWTMMNACNYVVNRDEYLSVYEENKDHDASDTIWMAYLWLKANNSFNVVLDMQYEHRVHPASGFLQDAPRNMKKAEEVKQMILNL